MSDASIHLRQQHRRELREREDKGFFWGLVVGVIGTWVITNLVWVAEFVFGGEGR